METRRIEEQGRELDDAGDRMRTASVLKEDKEWEKARAADRIVENFLKPVRKGRLQSQSMAIPCSLRHTPPLHCTVHHLLPL